MSALIILLILGIWSTLLYNAGYYLSGFLQPKWLRQFVGVVTVVGVTTLALWDEVIGVQEFEQLCKSAQVFQISPEAEGKKFKVLFSRTEDDSVPRSWRPTWHYVATYKDADTDQIIATGNGYRTRGGWLVRQLGMNPLAGGDNSALLGPSYCYPSMYPGQVQKLRAMINIDVK
jgi:hypothetical protein